jgi:hypothetical protein
MGNKQKWHDESDQNLVGILDKMSEIISPLFKNNGQVDLANLEKKSDLAYLLALAINTKFEASEDKISRGFGADNVIALKLEIKENKFLTYWGKINWLSTPNSHACFKSYQDPFYALFKFENNQVEIVEAMFGDYDKNDLDSQHWIGSDMNWMYDL